MKYTDPNYHKERSKAHYQKYKQKYLERNQIAKHRTRDLINAAKSSGCLLCSETTPCALDFHHLHGKDKNISRMKGLNDNKILEEIAKCVVLCANCHRKVHSGLISIPLKARG